MAYSESSMEIKIYGAEYSQEKIRELFQSITESDYYEFEYIKDCIEEDRTWINLSGLSGDRDTVEFFFCDLTDLIDSNFKDITVFIECGFLNLIGDGQSTFKFERQNRKDSCIKANLLIDDFSALKCPECGHDYEDGYSLGFNDVFDFNAMREDRVIAKCSNCSHEFKANELIDFLINCFESENFCECNDIDYYLDCNVE